MIINIQDDILKLNRIEVLEKLLVDKTTGKKIMWATDAYNYAGNLYERNREISVLALTGDNAGVLKTRARKEMEHRDKRTRQHAEVFTPFWVCKKMNDYADEVWFGKKDVFFKDGKPTAKVKFPKGQMWHEYVDSRRLEITCGEAPFLVSRYDVETGEMIPVKKRIGILDRKLRVVGENVDEESEWLKWATRAFQASYGYEFQGDNLLIARVNMIMTFEEYLYDKWNRRPTIKEYEKMANIITWNMWQMDGLTGTIPYNKGEDEYRQISIFEIMGQNDSSIDSSDSSVGDEENKDNIQPYCRIFDWRGKNRSVEYVSLRHHS